MVAEVCYRFLENPTIKSTKEVRIEIFSLFGTLVSSYNLNTSLVARMVQLLKMFDPLVQCIPEGIKILVEKYNCKSLIKSFIKEAMEWQVDDKYQDSQVNISHFVIAAALYVKILQIYKSFLIDYCNG